VKISTSRMDGSFIKNPADKPQNPKLKPQICH
jgi:hypothetical protein